jgi:hypothetical protein
VLELDCGFFCPKAQKVKLDLEAHAEKMTARKENLLAGDE